MYQIKVSRRIFPKMKRLQIRLYKGHKVEIWNNCYYGFRYEYTITPLKPQMAKFIRGDKKLGNRRIVTDPTSMPSIRPVWQYAKDHVDNLVSPFWWKK